MGTTQGRAVLPVARGQQDDLRDKVEAIAKAAEERVQKPSEEDAAPLGPRGLVGKNTGLDLDAMLQDGEDDRIEVAQEAFVPLAVAQEDVRAAVEEAHKARESGLMSLAEVEDSLVQYHAETRSKYEQALSDVKARSQGCIASYKAMLLKVKQLERQRRKDAQEKEAYLRMQLAEASESLKNTEAQLGILKRKNEQIALEKEQEAMEAQFRAEEQAQKLREAEKDDNSLKTRVLVGKISKIARSDPDLLPEYVLLVEQLSEWRAELDKEKEEQEAASKLIQDWEDQFSRNAGREPVEADVPALVAEAKTKSVARALHISSLVKKIAQYESEISAVLVMQGKPNRKPRPVTRAQVNDAVAQAEKVQAAAMVEEKDAAFGTEGGGDEALPPGEVVDAQEAAERREREALLAAQLEEQRGLVGTLMAKLKKLEAANAAHELAASRSARAEGGEEKTERAAQEGQGADESPTPTPEGQQDAAAAAAATATASKEAEAEAEAEAAVAKAPLAVSADAEADGEAEEKAEEGTPEAEAEAEADGLEAEADGLEAASPAQASAKDSEAIEQLQEVNGELKGRIEELEGELKDLRSQVESYKADESAAASKTPAAKRYLEKIKSAEKKQKEAEKQLKEAKNKANRLEQQVAKLERTQGGGGGGGGGGDAAKVKKELEELKKKQKKQLDELDKAHGKAVRALEKDVGELRKETAELKEALAAARNQVGELSVKAKQYDELAKESVDLREKALRADELESTLKAVEAEKGEVEEMYKTEMALRKKYWNMMEDMKGKIRVFARCRPMAKYELEKDCKQSVQFLDEYTLDLDTGRGVKQFVYDRVFPPESSQSEVFEDTSNLIQSSLDGYNVCVFAYGQTGSGKTWTMVGSAEQPGIVRRSVSEIFKYQEEHRGKKELVVRLYMLELYLDTLVDLLYKVVKSIDKSRVPKDPPKLDIKKDKSGTVFVKNSQLITVESEAELLDYFERANGVRKVASTKMNAGSSRSHMIFSVVLENTDLTTRKTTVGKLSLVDLAGSERQEKTGTTGDQFKEAMSINKSLSALGDVISALSSGEEFIPYRNNKLTQVMSDSLGGNAKTLMFVNISPADYNAEETASSLTYASRVKLITNKADKSEQNEEVTKLRKIIKELTASGGTSELMQQLELDL